MTNYRDTNSFIKFTGKNTDFILNLTNIEMISKVRDIYIVYGISGEKLCELSEIAFNRFSPFLDLCSVGIY